MHADPRRRAGGTARLRLAVWSVNLHPVRAVVADGHRAWASGRAERWVAGRPYAAYPGQAASSGNCRPSAALDNPYHVGRLLGSLREAGARAGRRAGRPGRRPHPLDYPGDVAGLLVRLREAGAHEQPPS